MGAKSPEYQPLVAQIKARSVQESLNESDEPEDPAKSVVFLNNSNKSVALLQVLWRFTLPDGREFVASCAWAGAEGLLLPFGIPPEKTPALQYRLAILPGSKRYITSTGVVMGDNTDVRAPVDNEIWKGGIITGSGAAYSEPRRPAQLRISIEGAFFEDGQFVGVNRTRLFEQITAKANAHASIAQIASRKSRSASAVLNEIENSAGKLTNLPQLWLIPEPDIPADVYQQVAFQNLAGEVQQYRTVHGDAATLQMIRSWSAAKVPAFTRPLLPAKASLE